MTDHHPIPWPASWPPFWRAVVHVLIAAGATNVLVGIDVILGLVCRSAAFFLAALITIPVVIMGWLCRAERSARWALYRAFFLGTLCLVSMYGAAAIWGAWLIGEDERVWAILWGVVLSACVGFAVVGWTFPRSLPSARRRAVWRAARLGALLLMLAWVWGGSVAVWGARLGSAEATAATVFAATTSFASLFTLTYAVVAMLLIRSTEPEAATGGMNAPDLDHRGRSEAESS